MQGVVDGGGYVEPELAELQDVWLKLDEHLYGKLPVEGLRDFLKSEDHVLINLDRDLQTHCWDYSQKSCVNHGVVADVGVEEVHSLHDSAIEAVRLDSEL